MKHKTIFAPVLGVRLLLLGLLAWGCAGKGTDMPAADLVLLNGKIVTIDSQGTTAQAAAVKFGRILMVGSNDLVKGSIGEGTRVIDLDGRTVIPGLIDAHCHMTGTALDMTGILDLSEEAGVKSIADIQARIAEKAESTPKGGWILGGREDDFKLSEKRHPTRWELDKAAPENPVLITTVGGHFSIANSAAFKAAGITGKTPDPPGGVFDRDPKTGKLTGGAHEEAVGHISRHMPPRKDLNRQEIAEVVKQMLQKNAAAGLTCIYDNAGPIPIRAVLDLKNKDQLPIRFRVDITIERFREMEKLGLTDRPFGDDWVKLCGLKFFFDGSISARTARVSEPFLNRENFYGVWATTEADARKILTDAYSAGYRISAHANGDVAIGLYLDIREELQSKYPRPDPRNRIIHCTVVNPELVRRIKELELLPTIFGAYPYYHGDKLLPAFGVERLENMFAARSFIDAGIKVTANSDHDASPYHPLLGIHALVNRKTKAGLPIGASQRISVMEALKLYTVNAAYQAFDEDRLGSIETGKLGDFVILGEDILTIPTEEIKDIPVDMTIVDGNVVYNRDS